MNIHRNIILLLSLSLGIISVNLAQTYNSAEADQVIKDQNGDKHVALFVQPNTFGNGGFAELRLGDHFHFIRTTAGKGMMVRDFNDIRFNTGWFPDNNEGITRLIIKENGRVGIGTTDPKAALHVRQDIVLGNDADNQKFIIHSRSNAKGDFLQISPDRNPPKPGDDIWNWGEGITLQRNGNVGIGTAHPDAKLAVKGLIHAQEIKVDLEGAITPDFVFEADYDLPELAEVEAFIEEHKHLPEIPSAVEVEANGVELGAMQMKLLQKIEELTLYLIEQEKRMERLEAENQKLAELLNENK
jgi:hypothetical protein